MRLAVEMRFKVSVAIGIPFTVSFLSKVSVGYQKPKERVQPCQSTERVINDCRSTERDRGRVIEAANDAFSKHESVARVGDET